ncbi:MAG: hypothetical protein HWE27_02985 [Gammaproteobacteria bacterium]|nr:hypothetical protein [Gammaproteobacteria bacterium]
MKVLATILIILIALVLVGIVVGKDNPGQWTNTWNNFKDSYSVSGLVTDSMTVFNGNKVKRIPLSNQEQQRVVYRWTDSKGVKHLSYERPRGVDNVEEVRLGDLEYKVEQSLTEEEKEAALRN